MGLYERASSNRETSQQFAYQELKNYNHQSAEVKSAAQASAVSGEASLHVRDPAHHRPPQRPDSPRRLHLRSRARQASIAGEYHDTLPAYTEGCEVVTGSSVA